MAEDYKSLAEDYKYLAEDYKPLTEDYIPMADGGLEVSLLAPLLVGLDIDRLLTSPEL